MRYCGYQDLIVVGLRDPNLSMKLQMIPDLRLEKAVTLARQSETVQQQQGIVRGEPEAIDSINSHKSRKMCKTNMHKPLLQGHHKDKHV